MYCKTVWHYNMQCICNSKKKVYSNTRCNFCWTVRNKAFIDIKLCPNVEIYDTAHYGQASHHPRNRKYITYRNATRGGTNQGHGVCAWKFGEDRWRGSRYIRADRQTCPPQYFTLPLGRSNKVWTYFVSNMQKKLMTCGTCNNQWKKVTVQ